MRHGAYNENVAEQDCLDLIQISVEMGAKKMKMSYFSGLG